MRRNIDLLENKWFTNLTWVGNMGSASIFVALDELVRTKELQKGGNYSFTCSREWKI